MPPEAIGEADGLGIEGVLRVTAPNAGPMTYRGTNSYIVGTSRECIVFDPGPDDPAHLAALQEHVGERQVAAILLTHWHPDHTALAAKAARRFDAPIFAGAKRGAAAAGFGTSATAKDEAGEASRGLRSMASSPALSIAPADTLQDEPNDSRLGGTDHSAYDVARLLSDGETLSLAGHLIEVVGTPGHTADHLSFALPDAGLLLTGDHVMGWSTSVVIPPDGSMAAYRASLDKLLRRNDRLFLPGHGDAVLKPKTLLRAMIAHRGQREAMIRDSLAKGPASVDDLVAQLYASLDPGLKPAAAHSIRAHLVELSERGDLEGDDPVTSEGPFRLA